MEFNLRNQSILNCQSLITSLAFSKDFMATGSINGVIKLWDFSTMNEDLKEFRSIEPF